ncbi:putative quinol monooxygenase [Cysteiniphilum halobium]|uniref:putative quinol monooxygenase n=1 Tax=Cysteiniphilum halobium TaxID=2219059 RepID=UPI000E654DC4|nr:hypothetical protein [Cysteiniphilum halobium]
MLNKNFCSIVPYFKIHDGKLEDFKAFIAQAISKAENEEGCLFYNYTISDDMVAHCREAYTDYKALLHHIENVGDIIGNMLKVSDLVSVEVHAPATDIDQLREPLKELNPIFYTVYEELSISTY